MTQKEKIKYNEILAKVEDKDKADELYLRWKCLTDLYFLGTKVFGWERATDKSGRRKRIDPKFHRWLAGVLEREADKMILVPRKHLKTTWVKARIIQRILQNPNIRIGLFSVSARLVELELAHIKRLLCTPLLRRLFPDIIPEPGKDYKNWEKSTANMLTMRRDPDSAMGDPQQEPQILALGSLAKITGAHIDELYCDDIIDWSTVTTIEQMKKTEDWWGYMQDILEEGGLCTITGTFYHYSDLYNKIIKEGQIEKKNIFIRPVIENGKLLYSSWFTHKGLEKQKKRKSAYLFSCQYMLNPVPKEEQIFPPPQPTFLDLPKQEYTWYITVDPAATTESYSDKTAVIVAAVTPNRFIYIVEAVAFKKDSNEIADYLIRKCLQYKPQKVGIELGLQTHLQYLIQDKVSKYERQNQIKVPALMAMEPIPISRKMSKGDRINHTLGSFVREGKVFVNQACTELMRQMEMFTGKKGDEDDLVDAASMLFAIIAGFARAQWYKPEEYFGGLAFHQIFGQKKSKSWRSNFAA